LVAAGLLGCGRIGFPAKSSDASVEPMIDARIDTPPGTPAAICDVARTPMPQMPVVADLVVAPTPEGYSVVWVDTSASTEPHGALLGPNRQLLGTTVPNLFFSPTALGGLVDAGGKLALSGAASNGLTLWVVERDLESGTPHLILTGRLLGHDPFPSDTSRNGRAFVTAQDDQIETSLVASDGMVNVNAGSQFAAGGTVTDLACTDGPDHSHCVWVETTGGGASQCIITDVTYRGSLSPVIGSHEVVASNCRAVRTASGPDPADSMIIVWVTVSGGILTHYSTGGVQAVITAAGSAPKVRFDGSRFWIAWLDGQGKLQLSSVELGGQVVPYDLADWVPLGPEAFELVRRGTETDLVLLSKDGVEFLKICS
jgi:hypothetical protein